MKNRILLIVIIITIIIGFYRFFIMHLYYKQDVDVGPMVDLIVKDPLSTLNGMPCDKIHVLNGYNYTTGSYRDDAIKDWITINHGYGTNVEIFLYSNNIDALKNYLIKKKYNKIEYDLVNSDYDCYFITFIEQYRNADNYYLPSGNYSSRVVFLKSNLLIEFYQLNNNIDVKQKEELIAIVSSYLKEQILKQENTKT
ncbi:hypothetical protein ACOBQJ_14295 [Pelotomaculum propionicicum]|uniref:hypothetical protein n=1 Tax=Pelotomaculum propionicicum TaxID=258475 RepID=UPI003B81E9C2